jgi:hypothetical protein
MGDVRSHRRIEPIVNRSILIEGPNVTTVTGWEALNFYTWCGSDSTYVGKAGEKLKLLRGKPLC